MHHMDTKLHKHGLSSISGIVEPGYYKTGTNTHILVKMVQHANEMAFWHLEVHFMWRSGVSIFLVLVFSPPSSFAALTNLNKVEY